VKDAVVMAEVVDGEPLVGRIRGTGSVISERITTCSWNFPGGSMSVSPLNCAGT
jgi:hypothetical protein